jgi:hypothetical protein
MNRLIGLLRALAGKVVVPHFARKLRRFEDKLGRAREIQHWLALEKVRYCRDTQFGRDHHFHEIRTLADFKRNIPIAPYDYYYPYIKQVTEGNIAAMFPPGEKILMYTLSSGTTDAPKLIPVTRRWMCEYRSGWQIWGIKAFLDHPALFYARLTGVAGNWDMRRTPTNLPCGMASGLSARLQSPLLRMMYCVPASVFEVDDPAAKYYLCLRLSVPERAGLFLTATPATVVNFAQLGDRYRDQLIRDVADGTITGEFEIPSAIRRDAQRRIKGPNPCRARELEQIVERTGRLYPKDYWNLSLVACWLGGTVGTYARHISDYYGSAPRRDIGLLCSEGRFTVPIEDDTPAGVLEIASHYYEFVPESEIDSPQPIVLEGHELEVGKSYFILLTTSSGLYRYNICDVLRCTGFVGQAPVLEFLHKGQRFSDMEGEKLTEYQFVKAVSSVAQRIGITVTGFTAVPVPSESTGENGNLPYYAIVMEEQDVRDEAAAIQFLEQVDRWLCDNNVMYQGKRADGYLGPLRLLRIPTGAWAQFDQAEIARRGVSEDHYKHPCLADGPALLRRLSIIDELTPHRPMPVT